MLTATAPASLGANVKKTLTYDSQNNVLTVTDARNKLTQYGYDTQGNNTVILHLNNRYAPITAQLADRSGMVMSPKALNDLGANFATNPLNQERMFVESVLAGKPPHMSGEAGRHDQAVVAAVYASAKSGRRERVPG